MDKKWYVACINDPRSLKYLPVALKSASKTSKVWIPTQLVMRKKQNARTKQDAWEEVERQLYPGYVFIQCDDHELCTIESIVKGSCRGWMLKAGGQTRPASLTEDEIKGLELIAGEHLNRKPHLEQFDMSIGQDVEMTAGPFKGFRATIIGIKKHMLQVETSILGRSTKVEVSIEQCVPASK